MTATEFKMGIKEIKESLRGLTLQLVHAKGYRPYFSLNEFGNAILEEEAKGNDFRINHIGTNNGNVRFESIKALAELIKTGTVNSIQFESFYSYKTTAEYMRSFGALD